MEFTKEQIFELTSKHFEKENGIQDLLEIMLESLMVAERREFLSSSLCDKWGRYYRSFRCRRDDASYKSYFTYRNYDWRIQSMIYTSNWIERQQKDFRRVTRMRGAMPNEESVLLLMGKTAMDKKSYRRQVPRTDADGTLFPAEKPPFNSWPRPAVE